MANTKRSPDFKLQIITDGPGRWPYLGNGYRNKKNGSITLVLDPRWKLVHEDGTELAATTGEDGKVQRVKLLVRLPFKSAAAE